MTNIEIAQKIGISEAEVGAIIQALGSIDLRAIEAVSDLMVDKDLEAKAAAELYLQQYDHPSTVGVFDDGTPAPDATDITLVEDQETQALQAALMQRTVQDGDVERQQWADFGEQIAEYKQQQRIQGLIEGMNRGLGKSRMELPPAKPYQHKRFFNLRSAAEMRSLIPQAREVKILPAAHPQD